MKKTFKKIGIILGSIGVFSIFTYNLPVSVKVAEAIAAAVFKFKLPPPPPNRGIAGNRVGGASRISSKDPTNEGTNSDRHLTALVPEYRNSVGSEITKVWGLTTNEYPTLYFYIPYTKKSISHIDFIIADGDNLEHRTVYRDVILSPKYPGIINFSLPQTSAPLKIDKLYQWELKLTMNRQLDKEISVKGWIQRSGLNSDSIDSTGGRLAQRIKQESPNRQAAFYAENGFWYDALATLAELRIQRPKDLAIIEDWNNILKSVNLGKLANKPFVKSGY
ncbi:DUF928 domain-containing protein [Chamaesiphon sp. VAR_48_metabat_135_sub]|uniref:DUF928 domain-containing protein n=1 Tax=Chamaesiphon sp. VAR_48_metabat_135_sub TaxID=2964699 RepID=UPI00286B9817|nr:DUF928 domain-containing protein [Chamaesiphon sp. VAR_48_metabat_135_sub]